MNTKRTHRVMAVGAPSLIMIFVVLCLTCFAALTLSSASAEKRLTEKAAENTAAYYAADATLQQAISRLDAALLKDGIEGEAFLAEVEALNGTLDDSGSTLTLTAAVNENTVIQVVLDLEPDAGRYALIEYGTQLVNEPEYNKNYLNLWGGE